jgi:hypothetical protein
MSSPRYNYPYPIPPQNVKVIFNYSYGSFDISWDDPSIDPRNVDHFITGVNIYRSIDSSEGPWIKLTEDPLSVNFYRDTSKNVLVEEELVDNSCDLIINDKCFIIKTKHFPIVSEELNDYEFNPDHVKLVIDGNQVRINRINPYTGELFLLNEKEYDPVFERYFDLHLPEDNSVIKISYTYNNLFLQKDFNVDQRIFYKITSVSSEGKESALEKTYQNSYQDLEGLSYIWANIISKQNYLLNQGGERAWLFIQKSYGKRCPEHDVVEESIYGETKSINCNICYGTGFVGGFIGPIEVLLAPFDAETTYRFSNKGRIMSKNNESFLTNYPVVRQGDLIVRRNGERYIIGPVKRKEPNGILVQQNFTVHILQPRDIRYRIGVNKSPEFNTKYHDEERKDKRYLETKGKTPRYRNVNRVKDDS